MANIAFIPICGNRNEIENTPKENGQFLYTTEHNLPNQIYADVERDDGTIDRVSLAGNYLDINGGEVQGDVTIDGDLTMEGDVKFTSSVGNSVSLKDIFKAVYPVGSIYMSTSPTNPATMFGGSWAEWGKGKVPVGVNTSESEFNTVEKTGGAKTHTLTVQQIPSHAHEYGLSESVQGTTITTTAFSTLGTNQINSTINRLFQNIAGSWNRLRNLWEENRLIGTLFPLEDTTYYSGTNVAEQYSASHTHGLNKSTVNTSAVGGSQAHNNLQPYVTCYMWKRVL